jgi:urease accessory protein
MLAVIPIVMATIMITADAISAAATARLLAWLSPAFPTGAYAYSHGLEWAVESRDISDGDRLLEWLADVLRHGAGRSDAILLRHAHRASGDPDALAEIAELARACCSGRERQVETLGQGGAFFAAATPWHRGALVEVAERVGARHIAYPVAVGALAGAYDIPEDAVTAAYLGAFTANLISAAVRLVPLGQTAGLRVLAALEPVQLAIVADTRAASLDDIGGCAFRSDLAAMAHETQYSRLFRS